MVKTQSKTLAQSLKTIFFFKILWKDQAEDGKRKTRCAGNGREKDWKKKKEKENLREQEPNKQILLFNYIIKLKNKTKWLLVFYF